MLKKVWRINSNDHFISDVIFLDDRRLFLEAPIPGYKGYIPRIRPTDTSVGLRYHEAVKKGLDRFASEVTHSTTSLPTQRDISTPK